LVLDTPLPEYEGKLPEAFISIHDREDAERIKKFVDKALKLEASGGES